MKRSFGDSIMALLRSLFGGGASESVSVADRISSASHTRLKVIVKPKSNESFSPPSEPTPKATEPKQTDDESLKSVEQCQELAQFVPPETKRLGNISQYRLAAYVSQLPEDEQKKALSQDGESGVA
jgi:hypothetical protein